MISISHNDTIVKRVAIYCRVSSAEQRDHGISIDDQIETLTRYATEHNYAIVDIYNDAGRTAHAKYTTRPELLRLLDDCKAGRVDTIIFTRLDRWFRSLPEYYAVQAILDANRVTWSAVLEDYNIETSQGKFLTNLMLSLAQAEAEKGSERVKSVLAYKRAKGEFTGGRLPLGYAMVNGKPDLDPATYDIVRACFDDYLINYSPTRVSRILAEHGMKTTVPDVTRMLTRKTYTGTFKDYTIPAYITEAERQKIKDVIASRSRDPKNDRIYLFSGLIRCARCGQPYISTIKKGRKRYLCKSMNTPGMVCHNPSMMEVDIEAALLGAISADMDSVSSVPEIEKDEPKSTKSLTQRLDRLKELYLDGDISRERYLSEKQDIQQQIEAIENDVPPAEPPELPTNWREAYQMLTEENRKAFWRGIMKKAVIENKNFVIEYH